MNVPQCIVPDCGRRAYARGLCQTHDKQFRATRNIKPIRPYRKRTPGTVKYSGLRLSEKAGMQLDRKAALKGLSRGAIISVLLEDWAASRRKRS